MHLSSRRSDDADVIRARLRALLDESSRSRGWLPDDGLEGCVASADPRWVRATCEEVDEDEDAGTTVPVEVPDPVDTGGKVAPRVGRHRVPGRTMRWDPGRRGARSLWIAGLAAAVLLTGWTWLDRPRVEPVPAVRAESTTASSEPSTARVGEKASASASAMVVVSVVGLVARPGLVTLPSGSRVAEAVEAAGGLLPEADPASVNLAAVITDGQQISVGVPGSADAALPDAGAAGREAAPGGLLNLNTAGAAELDTLPGIGPVLAQRIVDHRSREGAFTSVDQLDDVPGIGPAIATALAELVTV